MVLRDLGGKSYKEILDKEAKGVWVVGDGVEAESTGDPQSERRQREGPVGTEKGVETAGRGKRA